MSDPRLCGIHYGRHDGARVTATATRDDSQTLPYGWQCTCGASQRFPSEYDLERSAFRHTHPTRWDRCTAALRRILPAGTRGRRTER